MGPLIGEALTFVVRTFKGGRQLENTLETTIEKMNQPKQQGPSPEQIQAQQQAQAEQMRLQHEQQVAQQQAQLEQVKLQATQQAEQVKLQAQAQIEQFKAQQALELERMKQDAETQRQAYKAQLDAETKLQIAAMQAKAAEKPAAVMQIDSEGKMDAIADTLKEVTNAHGAGIADAVNQLGQMAQVLMITAEEMKKPKKRVIQRDANGKAVAAIEVTD